MILLDTSSTIDYLNGEEKVLKILQKYKNDKLAISVITLGELEVGFSRFSSTKQNQIKTVFDKMLLGKVIILLDVNQKIAVAYGNLQAKLMNKGLSIGGFDGLISATAIVHDIPLLTSDAGFKRTPGLKLI